MSENDKALTFRRSDRKSNDLICKNKQMPSAASWFQEPVPRQNALRYA
jgi:hypothetical protein